MSGECHICHEHALECTCRSLSRHQENGSRYSYRLLPLEEGLDPPSNQPLTKWINVHGREEHEAVIKDAAKCKELGLDQMYEIMVYLKRWQGWLRD